MLERIWIPREEGDANATGPEHRGRRLPGPETDADQEGESEAAA
ncbi:MAG TPA: hypothetical protein VIL18_04935 [Longimicrobiales bacterium]